MPVTHDVVDDMVFAALDVLDCLDDPTAQSSGEGSWSRDDWDRDTWVTILREAAAFARERIEPTRAEAGWEPPTLDAATGIVRMPPELRRAHRELVAAGWWRLEAPEALGGTPAPRVLAWSVAELLIAANPALYLYQAATSFLSVVHANGTAAQRQLAQHAVDRGWGASMVLTEADAGSDVGAIRTVAEPQPDGTWHLRGVKRFITSGEHDLADNIVHLVLARPTSASQPGTKGLSLFVVPSHHVEPGTCSVLTRNGVRATSLESKMGLRASVTCELAFGVDEPAVGTLLGDAHDGIAQMFQVIVHTRMLVGAKAVAALDVGTRAAREFARVRVQGTSMGDRGDRTAMRVTVDQHADVRRTLVEARAYADGLRTLVLLTAHEQDRATRDADPAVRTRSSRRAALLLPVLKAAAAERADEHLGRLLPVLGGSGYMRDYPLEQLVRDTKVDAIYEGTTAIQADDLLFRRLVRDGRAGWRDLVGDVRETVDAVPAGTSLEVTARAVARALADVDTMVDVLVGRVDRCELDGVGPHTRRLLLAVADVLVGWLLLRRAMTAERLLEHGATDPGGRGHPPALLSRQAKVARAFATGVLPRVAAESDIVRAGDPAIMALSDEEL
jgi:alkylation response protein AidB-like acyl-CoA dehydrogenase